MRKNYHFQILVARKNETATIYQKSAAGVSSLGEIYWKLEETVSQGYRDTGSLAKRGRKASPA